MCNNRFSSIEQTEEAMELVIIALFSLDALFFVGVFLFLTLIKRKEDL